MVKRTITITTIILILAIVVSLIIIFNRVSYAADGDIASGTSGTCSWVIDKDGVLIVSPTDGISGVLHSGETTVPPWASMRSSITKVVVKPGVKTNESTYQLFAYLENCTEMDVTELDTSSTTYIWQMFSNNPRLKNIDVSNIDTSHCDTLGNVFANCDSLRSLDLSNWDVSNIYNMNGLMWNCKSLEYVDISSFNTRNIRMMGNALAGCTSLTKIKLGENFSFNGRATEDKYRMYLPTQSNSRYTGKWIREDGIYGPYTSEELRNNYNYTMAGTWICEKCKYTVTYEYSSPTPEGASELPEDRIYEVDEQVEVAPAAGAPGYDFSGWKSSDVVISNGSFEMPTKDVQLTGSFIEVPKLYNYKVEYYFDGEIDDSLEEILNAEKDEEINLTPQTPVKHGEKNYTLVSNNHKITISVNDEDNIIRVYYETDVLDYAIDSFEDTTEGDGIPDKYQISITYKVENGNWNDGSKGTKTDIITLKDKGGNLSEEGTGTTTIPEVGTKPSEEYEVGTWNEEIPKEVSNKDDGKEYIYSYKKSEKQNIEQKEDIDITEASGKIYNPKTDDIVNKYLLVGIGGILVLALVSKIRRKYSRKAKKVQF